MGEGEGEMERERGRDEHVPRETEDTEMSEGLFRSCWRKNVMELQNSAAIT